MRKEGQGLSVCFVFFFKWGLVSTPKAKWRQMEENEAR